MTREEAIAIFRGFKFLPREMEAVDMAIKALEQEPCEDCISRKNTLAEFKRVYFDNDTVIRCAELVLGGMPSVTSQPKTGHWIDIMVGDMPAQACDKCNTFYPLAYTGGGHKYCPNCGRKMMQEVEER